MAYTKLCFGRHRGKTLPQVLFSDPDWFFHLIEEKGFKDKGGKLKKEARKLNKRARSIKIRGSDKEDLVACHHLHRPSYKFLRLVIRTRDQVENMESATMLTRSKLDLSIVRRISPYDKSGNKTFLADL